MRNRTALTALILIVLTAHCPARAVGASDRLGDDGSKLVGDWAGESVCVGDNPSCHDEKVVYHVSKSADGPDRFRIAADKIVDGRAEPMGVLDFRYDAEKKTLVGEFQNARYHGLWELTVKGDTMEGTLTLLPARTVARRVKVKKVN
jgi:hypothetical protein